MALLESWFERHETTITSVLTLGMALGVYSLGLRVLVNYPLQNAALLPRSAVEEVVREEKVRLSLDKTVVVKVVDDAADRGSSRRIGENSYEITLDARALSKPLIRHELYHVAAGHCDHESNPLLYWFYQEPAAGLYVLRSLKMEH